MTEATTTKTRARKGDGTVFTTKDGRHRAAITVPDAVTGRPVRRYLSGRTPAEVKAKLAAIKAWLKLNRARLRTRALWEQICVKIRGHFAYYGVTGNFWSLDRFLAEVKQLLFQWLNRRGGRRHMTWEQFTRMQRSFPFPRLHTRVNLYHFA